MICVRVTQITENKNPARKGSGGKCKSGENGWEMHGIEYAIQNYYLPNVGGALCSTPQSLADAHYYSAMQ